MIKDITKENGKVEYYEHNKAVESIFAAMQRCEDVRANRGTATKLVNKIEKELSEKFKDCEDAITTNDWAETAFKVLKKYNRALCDSYKERRMEKQLKRLQHSGLMRGFKDVLESSGDDPNSINTENANIDGFNPAAQLHRIGSEANKAYVSDYLLPKDIAKAHKEKWMHVHDMDYFELNPNCGLASNLVTVRFNGEVKQVELRWFDRFLQDKTIKDTTNMINIEKDNVEIYDGNNFVNVKAVSRRIAKKDESLVIIDTRKRRLCMTEEHIVPVKNADGDVVNKKMKDITLQDSLFPTKPQKITNPMQIINLIEEFGPRKDIRIANTKYLHSLIKEKMQITKFTKYYRRVFKEYFGKEPKDYDVSGRNMSLEEYYLIRDFVDVDESKLKLNSVCGKENNSINNILLLTSDLGRLAGLMISEGYLGRAATEDKIMKEMVFANNNSQLLDDFKACWFKCFPNIYFSEGTNNYGTPIITISANLIGKVFRDILCGKINANTIALPKWTYSANKDYISGLVGGMIDGDGCINVKNNFFDYSSVSKEVCFSMVLLLEILGHYNATVYMDKQSSKGTNGKINATTFMRNYDAFRVRCTADKTWNNINSIKIHSAELTNTGKNIFPTDSTITNIDTGQITELLYDLETESHYFSCEWIKVHNCLQVDLKAALKGGFNTGSSQNTEPQSIITAAMLSSIVLQSSTNGMHGGQSIANLDYALAKYVNISYRKAFLKSIDNYYALNDKEIPFYFKRSVVNKFYYGITVDGVNELLKRPLTKSQEKLYAQFIKIAEKDTEKETEQAMQGLCHNLSTLHSRAADQVPFSSVNLGLDVSAAGRLVTTKLLETVIRGAGNNETFIYPIVIFHVLEGVNYYPGDPNYDMYRLAIRSSAKRLYPNYNFIDSPFQFQFIRNKKGQLLWLAKEKFYIRNGFITKDELDKLGDPSDPLRTNLFERIRAVQEIERGLRKDAKKKKDIIFDVAGFVSGVTGKTIVKKAHAKGAELPSQIDELCAGLDDRTIPARMGCRTFVESDSLVACDSTQEPEDYVFERTERPPYGITFGRGNFNFVTMNLPKFALEAIRSTKNAKYRARKNKDITERVVNKFYQQLVKYMIYAKRALKFRQGLINKKPAKNFSFIVGENLIMGSDKLGEWDKTEDLWEHFSKSIGYIGLYETMSLLYSKDQVDDPETALEIIKFMRNVTDNLTKGYYVLPTSNGLRNNDWYKHLFDVEDSTFSSKNPIKSQWDINYQVYDINTDEPIYLKDKPKLQKGNWSLFATPAESTAGSFSEADLEEYGKIKDITDKGYYTNSNHVDVRRKITTKEKAKIEGPYHTLANAGNIGYIETDGFIGKNLSAYQTILTEMHDAEIGYAAVNLPVDFCNCCRYQGVIPEGEPCPMCGNSEDIYRIRRITGYLTGSVTKWNTGKRSELKNRVKHTNIKKTK